MQTGRYASDGLIDAAVAEAEAAAAGAARRKKRLRNLSILSAGAAVVLVALIAFTVLNRKPKPQAGPRHGNHSRNHYRQIPGIKELGIAPKEIQGVVAAVFPKSNEIELAPPTGGNSERVKVKDEDVIDVGDQRRTIAELKQGDSIEITMAARRIRLKDGDLITINDKPHLFDALALNDEVDVIRKIDPKRQDAVYEIHARHHGSLAVGKLLAKDAGQRTLDIENGDETKSDIVKVFVPPELRVALNGRTTFGDKPVTLATFAPGDKLNVNYEQEGAVNKAKTVEARRQVLLTGVLAADYDRPRTAAQCRQRQATGRQAAVRIGFQDLREQSALGRTFGVEARRPRVDQARYVYQRSRRPADARRGRHNRRGRLQAAAGAQRDWRRRPENDLFRRGGLQDHSRRRNGAV